MKNRAERLKEFIFALANTSDLSGLGDQGVVSEYIFNEDARWLLRLIKEGLEKEGLTLPPREYNLDA